MKIRLANAVSTLRLNRTRLAAGVKHASNYVKDALTQLGCVTLDLADRAMDDDELADRAMCDLRSAGESLAHALKTLRHTERHLAQVLGRDLERSKLDQIRAIVHEARHSDSRARTLVSAVLDDIYLVEAEQ